MSFLRVSALMMAVFVLILPPIFLSEPYGGSMAGWTVTALLLGLSLIVATFVYIALAGDRMHRRGHERFLGMLLLLIPMGGGLSLLASRHDPLQLCSSGILLASSMLLFLGIVFPSLLQRQRQMRPRERHDGILVPVQPQI